MRHNLKDVFETKTWGTKEGIPRSGIGSTLAATEPLRLALPGIFERYEITSFLDAPCGDWHWMSHVDLSGVDYIGADISTEIVEQNKAAYSAPNREFTVLDITSDPLPKADMLLCRDCLFHLKHWLKATFFMNFVKSEIPYLMTTMHYVHHNRNPRRNGGVAEFNPCSAPFNFAPPLEYVHETENMNLDPEFLQTMEGQLQRSLGIWSREQVKEALDKFSS